uniref:Large ribosomal subunit protein mL40 n=1 Tax=Strix occidentalis caurina TaxID=311401 RepID=A0A8D0EXX9_STROC
MFSTKLEVVFLRQVQFSLTVEVKAAGVELNEKISSFIHYFPCRAQPKKKKKVDVRKEQAQKDRMKKKIRKLEKAAPEMIPIEDFVTPLKYSDRQKCRKQILFETERRVLLMKKWCLFKLKQDKAEKNAIQALVEAQQEALKELRLESEELYQAAIRRDEGLFPFERDGPNHTPPLPGYDPPEGKCIDITKVYTQ